MQQRNVIVTAVLLAIILAGFLWYGLSRETDVTTFNTTTTTPIITSTPDQNVALINTPEVPAITPQNTPVNVAGTPIQPTAGSGTSENIIISTLAITLASAVYFVRALRSTPTHRINNN